MEATKSGCFITTVFLLGLISIASLPNAGAQTGVCYGKIGTGLPSPADVVSLYNQNNIRRMRIYDPDQATLQALGGSNIEVIVGVPNTDLQNVASSQANANTWVQNNIRNYGNVRFRYIAVGNEVSPLKSDTSQYVNFVLPAMTNIQNAINSAGLGNQIKVSTAVETGLITNSYPPSSGVFQPQVTQYITPIVQFLARNQAPLLANIYPFFAYMGDPAHISLEYALFTSSGIVTPDNVKYQNLFDALLDATYAALEKAGGSNIVIVVSESGWPSAGANVATVNNAGTYVRNLIKHVQSTGGTPKRPGRSIETYVFSMFDENQKNPETEKHFGIFQANRQPKYQFSFS